MRRALAALLAVLALVVGLAACGVQEPDLEAAPPADDEVVADDGPSVGVGDPPELSQDKLVALLQRYGYDDAEAQCAADSLRRGLGPEVEQALLDLESEADPYPPYRLVREFAGTVTPCLDAGG